MAEHGWPEEAREHFERGYEAQMAGRIDAAIESYRRSIAIHPSAEAHTFLGWVYSMLDRYEDAIEECHQAIALDPTFGNPYNDIGAYFIELGWWKEAIPCPAGRKTAAGKRAKPPGPRSAPLRRAKSPAGVFPSAGFH